MSDKSGRPEAVPNLYKHGVLKSRKEIDEEWKNFQSRRVACLEAQLQSSNDEVERLQALMLRQTKLNTEAIKTAEASQKEVERLSDIHDKAVNDEQDRIVDIIKQRIHDNLADPVVPLVLDNLITAIRGSE